MRNPLVKISKAVLMTAAALITCAEPAKATNYYWDWNNTTNTRNIWTSSTTAAYKFWDVDSFSSGNGTVAAASWVNSTANTVSNAILGEGSGSGMAIGLASNVYADRVTFKVDGFSLENYDDMSGTRTNYANTLFLWDGFEAIGSATVNTAVQIYKADNTWSVAPGKTLTVRGVISDSSTVAGEFSLSKTGAGLLVLTGANSFNGGLYINEGGVQIGEGGTAGSILSQAVRISSGAYLDVYKSNAATLGSVYGSGTINKWGGSTLTVGSLGVDEAVDLSFWVDSGSGLIVNQSSTANYNYTGVISGGGYFTKNGAGTLIMAGEQTYQGGTNIGGGTLSLQGAGALPVGNDVNMTGTSNLEVATGQTIGVLNINANATISGSFIEATNILVAPVARSSTVTFSSALEGAGGLEISQASGYATTVDLQNQNWRTGITKLKGGTLLLSNDLAIGSSVLEKTGGTLSFNLSGSGVSKVDFVVGGLSGTSGFSLRTKDNLAPVDLYIYQAVDTVFSGGISGSGGMIDKRLSGKLTLSGTNTFTGIFNIDEGSVQIGNGGTTGSIATLDVWVYDNASIIFNRSNDLTYAGWFNGNGGLVKDGAGVLTLTGYTGHSGGTSVLAGGLTGSSAVLAGNISAQYGTVVTFNQTADGQFNGTLSGAGSLVKSGTFALTLAGSQTYDGGTTVSAGVLRWGNSNVFNSSAGMWFFVGGGGYESNAITLSGGDLDIGAYSDSVGNIYLNSSASSIEGTTGVLSPSSIQATFTGTTAIRAKIGGTGSLYKNGTGLLGLYAANTFTGDAIVGTGTLRLYNANALSLSTLTMAGGALVFDSTAGTTFNLGGLAAATSGVGYDLLLKNNATTPAAISLVVGANNKDTVYRGVLSGTGSLTKTGTGTLVLSGASNSFTGGISILSGALQLGESPTNGNTLSRSVGFDINIANGARLVIKEGAGWYFYAAVRGAGAVVVDGGTYWQGVYGGKQQYTGGTYIINGGTLRTDQAEQLPLNGLVSITGGALDITSLNNSVNGETIGQLSISGTQVSNVRGVNRRLTTTGVTVSSSANVGIETLLQGTGGLAKSGAGTLTLSGVNTFAGGTSLSAGKIAWGASNIMPDAGAISVTGGEIALGTYSDAVGAMTVSGTAPATISGSGTLTPISLAVSSSADVVASVNLAGTWGLQKGGAGTLSLSGTNAFTGASSVTQGTVIVSGTQALGTGGAQLSLASGAALQMRGATVSGKPLSLAGDGVGASGAVRAFAGSNVWSGAITLTAASRINTEAGATLALTSSSAVSAAGFGLTIGGGGGTSIQAGLALGAGGLVKEGTGTLTLAGTSTYGGATIVTAGALNLTGAIVGSSTQVASGATLRGAGVLGPVALSPGANLEAGIGGVGSLAAGNLTVNGAGAANLKVLNVENYAAAAAFSLGDIAGLGAGKIKLVINGTVGPGSYRLISYTGAINQGIFEPFVFSGEYAVAQSLGVGSLDFSVPGLVSFVVGADQSILWRGTSADWMGGASWKFSQSGSATAFIAGNDVAFDDSAASGLVQMTADVAPRNIRFIGDSLDYTLADAGGVMTAGTLSKSGDAVLTVLSANTFGGGTNLSAGRIRLGNDQALGLGMVSVSGGTLSSDGLVSRVLPNDILLLGDLTLGHAVDSGVLILDGGIDLGDAQRNLTLSSDAVIDGVVSGGSLVKSGSATLTLSNQNTYQGATTVDAGTLVLGHAFNTLDDNSAVAIMPGAVLDLGANTDVVGEVVLLGGAILGNGGALVSARYSVANGASSAFINATLAGPGMLTKSGSGELILAGPNGYTGGTALLDGTLRFSAGALGQAGAISLQGGTLLWSTGNTQDISSRIDMIDGGVANLDTNGNDVTFAAGFGSRSSSSLRKTGLGALTLSGDNTFTGGFDISQGRVNVNSASALGLGQLTLRPGVVIDNTSGVAVVVDGLTSQTWSGGFTFYGSNPLDLGTSPVDLAADVVISGNPGTTALLTIGGPVSGSGKLTIGANQGEYLDVVLTGANNYTGGTTVLQGRLTFSAGSLGGAGDITVGSSANSAELIWAAGNTEDISSRIFFSPAGHAFFNTNGNDVEFASSIGNGAAGAINKEGAGTLTLLGANNFTGGMLVNGPASRLALGHPTDTLADSVYLWLSNGATVDVGANSDTVAEVKLWNAGCSIVGSGTISASSFLVTNDTGEVTISAHLGGSGSLTKTGRGTLLLSASNQHSGGTIVSGGVLRFESGALATGSFGQIIVDGGVLQWAAGNTQDISVPYNFNSSFSRLGTSAGKVATLDTNGNDVLLSKGFDGVGTTGSLKKIGQGRLTLGGTSYHRGGTVVEAGVLALGHPTDTLFDTGTLTINGGILDIGANIDTVGAVVLGGGAIVGSTGRLDAASFAINHQSGSIEISSSLGGAASVVKSGAGILALSAANSYSGGTTIAAGTVSFSQGGLSTTGDIAISGGKLQWASGNQDDLSPRLRLVDGGAPVFDTNGNNVTLAAGFGGSSTSSLTKVGAGTLVLSGINSYTGGTTVSAGKLVINGSIGSVAVSSGAVLGGVGQAAAVSLGAGATLAPGNSIGTLSASSLSLSSSSVFNVEFNANAADLMIVTGGPVLLDGQLLLTYLSQGGATDAAVGAQTRLRIIDNAGLASGGAFSNISFDAATAALFPSLIPNAEIFQNYVDLYFTEVQPIGPGVGSATDVNLAGTHVGVAFVPKATTISNLAATGFGTIDAALSQGGSSQAVISQPAAVAGIQPGESKVAFVGLATPSAPGAVTGQVLVNFTSTPGNISAGNQLISVVGTAYEYASATLPAAIDLGSVRRGSTQTGDFQARSIELANLASSALYGENLNASWGVVSSPAVARNGMVLQLAPGETSTALSLGLNPGLAAGAYSETATLNLTSVALPRSGVSDTQTTQQIIITGKVYDPAAGLVTLADRTIDLGTIRVGGAFQQRQIEISNTSAPGAYAETLKAEFGASSQGVVTSGTISGLAAGQASRTLGISLSNVAAPGAVSGTSMVSFTTQAQAGSGLTDEVVGSQIITVTGNVSALGDLKGATIVDSGRLHVGGSFPQVDIAVENRQANALWVPHTEHLAVSVAGADTGLWHNAGAIGSLAPTGQDHSTIKARITDTTTAGDIIRRLTLTGLSLSPDGILPDQPVAALYVDVTGLAYTGKGTWGAASGSYDDWSKWARLGGQPGIDGALSVGDTATFSGAGANTVALNGVSPELQALNFTSAAGTTLLANGNETVVLGLGGVTRSQMAVSGGTHHVAAPVVVNKDLEITASQGSVLRFEAPVTAVGNTSLSIKGSGTVEFRSTVTASWSLSLQDGAIIRTGLNQSFSGLNLQAGQLSAATEGGQVSSLTAGTLVKTGPGIAILGDRTAPTKLVISGISGTADVAEGTLRNNAVLRAPVVVRAGATLGGNGFADSITVQAGGRLAPGNSIDVITTSALNLSPAGFYDVEFNAFGADKTVVTVGPVVLGGRINLVFLDESRPGQTSIRNKVFRIIENTGLAVTGSFAAADVAFDAATAALFPAYAPKVTTFDGFTELSFVSARNYGVPSSVSSQPSFLTRTSSQFANTLKGDPFSRLASRGPSSAQGVSLGSFIGSKNDLNSAVSGAAADSWVQGYAESIQVNQGAARWGYGYQLGGVAAGLDLVRRPTAVLGVAFGLSQSDATHEIGSDRTNATAYDLGLYWHGTDGWSDYNLAFYVSRYSLNHKRMVDMAGTVSPVSGAPDASRFGVAFDYDRKLRETTDSKSYLHAAVGAGMLRRGAYGESGDEAAIMTFDAVQSPYLQLDMGLGYAYELYQGSKDWRAFAEIMVTGFVSTPDMGVARFINPAGSAEAVTLEEPPTDYIQLRPTLGLAWSRGRNSAEIRMFTELRFGKSAPGVTLNYRHQF